MRILDLHSTLLLVATGCTTGRVVAAAREEPRELGRTYTLRDDSELWSTGEIVRCDGDFLGPLPGDFAAPVVELPRGTRVTLESVELRWNYVRHLSPIGTWNRVEQLVVSCTDPRHPARRLTGRLLFSDLVPEAAAEQVRRAAA